MTVLFCCGFNCNLVVAQGGDAAAHFTAIAGTPAVQAVALGGFGPNSLLIDTTGAAQARYVQRQLPASTRVVIARFYVRRTTNPAAIANIFHLNNANGDLRIQMTTTGTLRPAIGGTGGVASAVLTQDVDYFVDVKFDSSSGTARIDWALGLAGAASGTAQTPQTLAQVAADMTAIVMGTQGSTTIKIALGHIRYDDSGGSYPIGPGRVAGNLITACGTHGGTGFTNTDFQNDAGTALATGETASFAKVDEVPPVYTNDHVKQVAIRAGAYLEYLYGYTAGFKPRAVEQVVFIANVSNGADTQKAQLYDGTAADAYALTTAGGSAGAIRSFSKQWSAAPSGAAWTTALAAALRIRWGFSTDVTTNPALVSSILEVEYGLSPELLTQVIG